MITKAQFLEDVRAEVVALRENATKEELSELSVGLLSSNDTRKCIYGQMTGDCYSERADALLDKCAVRVMQAGTELSGRVAESSMIANANGPNDGHFKNRSTLDAVTYFSALEAYIALQGAKNANVISYLRGETETLEL